MASADAWSVGEFNPGVPPTVTGRRTLTEHWDGTAWRVVRSPNESFPGVDASYLKDADAVTSDDVWAVGFGADFGSLDSRSLTIHWDGSAWSVSFQGDLGSLSGVATVPGGGAWAVGSLGQGITVSPFAAFHC